jgi:hypothetical protein
MIGTCPICEKVDQLCQATREVPDDAPPTVIVCGICWSCHSDESKRKMEREFELFGINYFAAGPSSTESR